MAESFTLFYITFIEDIPAKAFDFIGYIPAFIIGNTLIDIVQ